MSLLCRLKNLVHKGFLKKEDLDRIIIIPKEPNDDTVSRGVFEQIKWERDVAIEQLEELGYVLGQKIEPCKDYMKREFIEIVVNYPPADLCIYPEYKGKPYYSIKYRENGEEHVGFGTYKIEIFSQWIKEYFIQGVQPKTGHWIVHEDCEGKTRYCVCDLCDYETDKYTWRNPKYCAECGAKMEETAE